MKIKSALCTLILVTSLTGCSPFYVMRAAYEESKILRRRQDISKVIADESTEPEVRRKLQLVLDARELAIKIGLEPKESFTKYAKVDKDVLAWVTVGSKPDAFELYTWWFPIVGSVPYKGYFDREDADAMAAKLEKDGYETWVRGTDAMSTLGWFNDPVLSTTLKRDDFQIVNTVAHEITHSTVWIKNHVDFNESLANFVGIRAAAQFYRDLPQADGACREAIGQFDIADSVERLYDSLDKLYKSPASRDEKLAQRTDIFIATANSLRSKYPKIRILSKINNAELIQLKLYMTGLFKFEALFRKVERDWRRFIDEIKAIRSDLEKDRTKSPFTLLSERVGVYDVKIDHELCR